MVHAAPCLSVLMTVFNGAPWLAPAIDSIIAQTFVDWELVVVENGSTDSSPQILASYADSRIRVVAAPSNIGRTPALRMAFGLARATTIAVLDADDLAAPIRFERQLDFLHRNPDVSVVGSWTQRIDAEGREIGIWTPPTDRAALLDLFGYANPIVHSSAMYRAAPARAVGGYSANFPYAQDCALWLRLLALGPPAIIGEVLCSHRTLAGGMTRKKSGLVLVARDTLATLEYAAAHLTLSDLSRARNREERTIAAVRCGLALVRSARITEGCRMLADAAVRNPRGLFWNRVVREALLG
jgi:glycosyltransferase involved in cell wall biosynthesis